MNGRIVFADEWLIQWVPSPQTSFRVGVKNMAQHGLRLLLLSLVLISVVQSRPEPDIDDQVDRWVSLVETNAEIEQEIETMVESVAAETRRQRQKLLFLFHHMPSRV